MIYTRVVFRFFFRNFTVRSTFDALTLFSLKTKCATVTKSNEYIYTYTFIYSESLSERICSYGSTSFFIEWRWNVINQILFSLNGGVPLLWTLCARPECVWIITKGNRSQKVKTGAWRWCKKTDKKVTVKIYEMNIPTHKNQLLSEQDVCACSQQW